MTRTMYDGVTASSLPLGGWGYLFYVDGTYANGTAVKARTPGKVHIPVTIGRTAAARGMVLDVETGDATPADAYTWCRNYPGSNTDLTIYCNSSSWAAVKSALAGLTTKPNYLIAQYDNIATIPAGAIGKQYKNTAGYDESVVANYWPGVDPAPVVAGPVTFRGVKLDPSTVTKLLLAEALVGFTLSFPQGSYNAGGVAASAGTHDGGGAVDVHCNTYTTAAKVTLVHYLRAVGFAAWHRPLNWDGAGGSEHVHCEEIGNPNLSSGAAAQIVQWNAHENGLADHGADNEPVDVAAGRPARITAVPKPEPAPTGFIAGEEIEPMTIIYGVTGSAYYVLFSSGKVHHITSTNDLVQWRKLKVPELQFSAGELAKIVAGA